MNPFNFKHFNASQVGIYLNPLKLNFTDNQYIDEHRGFFATSGRKDMDNGLDIMRVDYKPGYCILGFDTSPIFCHGEPQERKEMKLCKQI